jgi:hypothetical protein
MHELTPAVACVLFAGMSLVAFAFVLAFVPETREPRRSSETLSAQPSFSRRSLHPHDADTPAASPSGIGSIDGRPTGIGSPGAPPSGISPSGGPPLGICTGVAGDGVTAVRLERSDSQDSAFSEFNACAGNAKGWSASPTQLRTEEEARTSLL